MKPFRFDAVRRVRAIREKEAQRAFAERRRAWLASMEVSESIDRERDATLSRIDALRVGAFDPREDLLLHHHLGTLADRRHEEDMRRERLRVEMDSRREAMLGAMRDRRIMDRLMERDLERWRLETERREVRELSESTILRHGRDGDDHEIV